MVKSWQIVVICQIHQSFLPCSLLKHCYEWCTEIQYEGWSWVTNTAWGKAKCCIQHYTPPSVVFFCTSWVNYICFNWFIVLSGSIISVILKWWTFDMLLLGVLVFLWCHKIRYRVAMLKIWLKLCSFPGPSIDISSNKLLSDDEAVAISECLKHSKTLKVLDISDNNIIEGVNTIAESIQQNTTLLCFVITNNRWWSSSH